MLRRRSCESPRQVLTLRLFPESKRNLSLVPLNLIAKLAANPFDQLEHRKDDGAGYSA